MKNSTVSKCLASALVLSTVLLFFGCGKENSKSEGSSGGGAAASAVKHTYEQNMVHSVNGRQGICVEGDYYFVSGSASLTKYDTDFKVIAENTDPFVGYELEVNHIGDIDIYNNELYLGVEYFEEGVGKNIQVAVYDGDSLSLKRVFPFNAETGQKECSGIAVDGKNGIVYMSSWIDDSSSSCLYMYDLSSGDFKGKLEMSPAPKWIQGVACYDGALYVSCDDGDADKNEADSMYRVDPKSGEVTLEYKFEDVRLQGEIEGLCFDGDNEELLLLYNRGAVIVDGMPTGYYEGYTEEIHEVYGYIVN